jgi:type IV pilus assembly protein PilE
MMLDLRGYVAVATNTDFPSAPTAGGINLPVPPNTTSNYTFKVDQVNNAATPPTFRVYATAIGNQATDGDLTLDQTGAKTPASKW